MPQPSYIAKNRLDRARRATIAVGFALTLVAGACGGDTAPSSTEAVPPSGVIELTAESIGILFIGEPPNAVLEELNSRFGEPNVDSEWIPADSPLYGSCPGEQMRAIAWGSLYAFFVADETVDEDNEHIVSRLYSYSYGYDFDRNEGGLDPRGLGLRTDSGVGIGTTVAELESAVGPELEVTYNASADTWHWSDGTGLQGLLSGDQPTDQVVLIETARGCELG